MDTSAKERDVFSFKNDCFPKKCAKKSEMKDIYFNNLTFNLNLLSDLYNVHVQTDCKETNFKF